MPRPATGAAAPRGRPPRRDGAGRRVRPRRSSRWRRSSGIIRCSAIWTPSADTQWIRVMPLRPLKPTSAGPSSDVVTLEEHGHRPDDPAAGLHVQVRLPPAGSPHRVGLGPQLLDVAAHRTRRPLHAIHPGGQRRGRHRRDHHPAAVSCGAVGHPVAGRSAPRYGPEAAAIPGTEDQVPGRLRCLHGHGLVQGGPRGRRQLHHLGAEGFGREAGRPVGAPRILGREFWLVGSDSSWPSGVGSGPAGVGAAILSTNVENAVGLVVGVLTRSFPYGECTFKTASSAPPEYCTLNYDLSSTSLEGTVSEPWRRRAHRLGHRDAYGARCRPCRGSEEPHDTGRTLPDRGAGAGHALRAPGNWQRTWRVRRLRRGGGHPDVHPR